VGHAGLPPVARSIDLEWSDDALADLDRFAAFLHEQSPELAAVVAQEIIARAQVLSLSRTKFQNVREDSSAIPMGRVVRHYGFSGCVVMSRVQSFSRS
jgi:plasmid stabilization system protein ParE